MGLKNKKMKTQHARGNTSVSLDATFWDERKQFRISFALASSPPLQLQQI